MKNITKLNELFYVGAKLICEKSVFTKSKRTGI